MSDTLATAEQRAALSSIQDLLAAHFSEAVDCANDDGKFGIGFRVTFDRSFSPTKVKIVSRISRTSTDEIETEAADPAQPALL